MIKLASEEKVLQSSSFVNTNRVSCLESLMISRMAGSIPLIKGLNEVYNGGGLHFTSSNINPIVMDYTKIANPGTPKHYSIIFEFTPQ